MLLLWFKISIDSCELKIPEFHVEALPIQLLRGTVNACHLFSCPLLTTMLKPSRESYCTKRAIWMNTFTDILLLIVPF